MRLKNLLSLLALPACLSLSAKTYTEGIFLYTTIDDNTCKVEQADATVKITESKIEIPAVVNIDGKDYRVTEIADNGFKSPGSIYNTSVKEIILPEGLLVIGESAFENYSKVTTITLPNSLSTLKTKAFRNVTGLTTITIGTGLETIPTLAFERDGNISNVKMLSATPPTLEDKAFPLPMFITLTVPKGAKDAYASAPVWSTFQTIIEDGTAVIEVPRPEISMDESNMVSITCSDPRASIYYGFGTISPDKTSGTFYSGPFLLEKAAMVRAVAYIDDFKSPEAFANLEPRVQVTIPENFTVFLNGHDTWGSDRNMAWHSYPIAADGFSSRVSDILGEACVWAEPCGDLLYMFSFDSFSTSVPVYHLTTYDRGTLEFVDQEVLPNDFIANDLAVDPVTGNIYGVFTSSNKEAYWGYVNLETKTRTNVARYDLMYNDATIDRIMALCFNPKGEAYALTFKGRLLKFDRETGAYSIIGETNWNINYVSCARWDEQSGQILYAFSSQDGLHYLYTIDPETAERKQFAQVPGSISAFFTPNDYVKPKAPAAPQNVELSFGDGGSRSGKLSFKAPALSENGEEISGNLDYRVVRKGKTVASGTVRAGGLADVDILAPMDGVYSCSVVLSNNYGESLRVKTSAFAGNDTPATPEVHAENTGEGIRVSWNAVDNGATGGYVDPTKVRYNVTRYPGKEAIAVATAETSLIDVVELPETGDVKQYYYTVTAAVGENLSAAGKSNKVVLGYFTPTWTETFDKIESMDNFTIINNSGYVFDDDATSGWEWNNYWRCAGAFYHPYESLDDWLITPPLMMEKGKTYRLSFKAGATPNRNYNYLEVCLGTDNTQDSMSNVLMEKFNVTSANQKGDWMTPYTVDVIPAEDGIHFIGFHCLSQADQLWLYLDNVSVLEGVIANAPKWWRILL